MSGIRDSFDRRVAILVATTSFMEFLDGTVVQTAAPLIGRDFRVSAAFVNIIIVAYLLALAVCIPASGWLADRFGPRWVFLAAIVVFTLASILCAIAPTLALLTLFRVIQGIGGAMMVPVGRLLVLRDAPPRELLGAIAYLTWPSLLAPVVAPVVGGLIADTIGWRWIFVLNVPIGAACLAFAWVLVTNREHEAAPRLDWAGLSLLAIGLAGLVVAGELVVAGPVEWSAFVASLVVAAAALTGWVWLSRRSRNPILDLTIFAIPSFQVGNAGGGVYRLMITAVPFLVTLLFQEAYGWSAVGAGAVLIALFVGNLAVKPATSWIVRRLGFRATLVWSNLAGIALLVALAFTRESTPIALVIVVLLLSGAARSIGFSAYNTVQFADVPPQRMSAGNVVSATVQQVAVALGIAVAAIIARVAVAATSVSVGYHLAFVVAAAILVIPLVEAIRAHTSLGFAAIA